MAIALHLLLLALAVGGARAALETAPTSEFLSDGIRRGGGGGGGEIGAIYIGRTPAPVAPVAPTPAVPVVPPPAVPVPPVRPQPVTPTAPVEPSASTAALPAATGAGGEGTGTGGGAGSGTGTGSGDGAGPGTGTGTGGGAGDSGPVSAPVWRAGALPFEPPPKDLRGRSVRVTFQVRADGRVEGVTVEPTLTDRAYAERFEETMRTFRFAPARTASGQAVAATAVLTFQLPSR